MALALNLCGLYAGVNAKTAPEPDNPRWFEGMDNKERFEINDSKAMLKNNLNPEMNLIERLNYYEKNLGRVATLGEVLHHEELFAAYPDFKNIHVAVDEDGQKSACFDTFNKFIKIGSMDGISADEINHMELSTLIHETQHAIQCKEGFAIGSNDKEYLAKDITLEEIARVENTIKYFENKDEDFAKVYPEIKELLSKQEEDKLTPEQEKRLDFLIDDYGDVIRDINSLENELKNLKMNGRILTPEEQYLNDAGEIEAFDVIDRLHLTGAERQEIFPDICLDATIHFDERTLSEIKPWVCFSTTNNVLKEVYNVDPKPEYLANKNDPDPVREYQNQAKNLLMKGHAPGFDMDKKIITDMTLKNYTYDELNKALSASPYIASLDKEQINHFKERIINESGMAVARKVNDNINTKEIATYIQSLNNVPNVKELPRNPMLRDLFQSYAKDTLAENNNMWSNNTNKLIAEKMLKNSVDSSRVVSAMKYSPVKIEKLYSFVRGIEKQPEIKALQRSLGMSR